MLQLVIQKIEKAKGPSLNVHRLHQTLSWKDNQEHIQSDRCRDFNEIPSCETDGAEYIPRTIITPVNPGSSDDLDELIALALETGFREVSGTVEKTMKEARNSLSYHDKIILLRRFRKVVPDLREESNIPALLRQKFVIISECAAYHVLDKFSNDPVSPLLLKRNWENESGCLILEAMNASWKNVNTS